jgi:hypothetical protein
MPSATPVPRGPSMLALGGAADLLTRPGCPACRYAAEASDRYLAWFALEAHADPVIITRLCASLGMCARHTRGLMSQPGAAPRLTAVYRYLLQAAGERLAEPGMRRPTVCPACEHDQDAIGRVLDTLLDELSGAGVRARYLELGGLCWPHVRAAPSVRRYRHRRVAAWIAQVAAASTAGHRAGLDVLAGGPDYDADTRARLRAALPPEGSFPAGTCPACLTAARAELTKLTVLARPAGTGARWPGGPGDVSCRQLCLCPAHLRDAALASRSDAAALLARQAEYQAAALTRLGQPTAWWQGGYSARRRDGPPSPAADDGCPVCQAREQAARQELRECRAGPQAVTAHGGALPLCVRHVLALRAVDPAAGTAAAAAAAEHAGALIGELTEAFRKGAWAFRHESRGTEMTAWRRAAAFLDGGVFGGCLPE